MACAAAADATTLALAAAAYQTGGRVVCILRGIEELRRSQEALGAVDASNVEFVTGEAQKLVLTQYREADFVLIDCNLENHEGIFKAVLQVGRKQSGVVVVGYNAFSKGSWWCGGARTQLLPIGEGLLVTRINARNAKIGGGCGIGKSHWVVKVDKFTGEEHVFRVRFPQGNQIQA